jgi:recombinational DNA repair protein RecR
VTPQILFINKLQIVHYLTIARGISVGDELEFAGEVTLGRSILHRVPFERV